MFNSLESFSVFFFIVASAIILSVFFEDKLVALEEERIRKKEIKRANRKSSVRR